MTEFQKRRKEINMREYNIYILFMLHLKQGHQLTFQRHDPAQMQCFQLTPMQAECLVSETKVDFSPVNGISSVPRISSKREFLPCLFTSPLQQAQLYGNEQKSGSSTEEILTETFKQKVSQAKEDGNCFQRTILKAKPSSNYCQICKQKFADFEQHTKHQIHRKKVSQSEFSRHIERLVCNFQIQQKKDFKRSKPVCQKNASYSMLQRPVKKIVIAKEECGTVSITKVDSVLTEREVPKQLKKAFQS